MTNTLITGATSGIGLQAAMALCEASEIVNISRRGIDQNYAKFITHSFMADLTKGEVEVARVVDEMKLKVNQKFDTIILSAGSQKISPLIGIRERDLHEMFELNLFSNLFLIKHLVRKKMLAVGGKVIAISSISSARPEAGMASYSMTKSALDTMVSVAAIELAKQSVRVNSVRYGLLETNLMKSEKAYTDDFLSKEYEKYPLGKGELNDAVEIIKFLASDRSKWITGQHFVVDGGRSGI